MFEGTRPCLRPASVKRRKNTPGFHGLLEITGSYQGTRFSGAVNAVKSNFGFSRWLAGNPQTFRKL